MWPSGTRKSRFDRLAAVPAERELAMIYLWALLLIVLNTVWLALSLIGLPGNWLMVISAALMSWLLYRSDPAAGALMIGLWTLVATVVLAGLGELLEFLASAVGSKRAGGTRWGAAGALVGGVIGGVVGTFVLPMPVLGTLIGTCGGAAAGAAFLELATGREFGFAVKSGTGAGVGRLAGTLAKTSVGLVIWLMLAVAAFCP